ncbi:MAG: type II toxin-antitoxin system RelE/ParE family toxin [candidate division KSB1 bacterium]
MSYFVFLTPAAERERRKLPSAIKTRINQSLLGMETDPRPAGVTKMTGGHDRWRIRVGDYRVIYSIDDHAKHITVLRIAHRREVYRD